MAKRKRSFQVYIDPQLCKGTEGCGICVDLCRPKVLGIAESLSARGVHLAIVQTPEECTGCDLCMLYCPELAVAVDHRESVCHV